MSVVGFINQSSSPVLCRLQPWQGGPLWGLGSAAMAGRKAELASWRAAVLEMGKVKRKEDEALWSRQVAKGFGQLLKFFKKLK